MRVWSLAVRSAHAVMGGSVISALVLFEGGTWHEWLGCAAGAVALWRVLHGLLSRDAFARFDRFVRGPAATWSYARALLQRREPHHLGHNPLGGWMILLLLLSVLLAAGSGWLYTTDRFWGDPLVYGVHRVAGWSLVLWVPLHLAGVVYTSWRQRENLALAMVTGEKVARPSQTA